MKKIEEARERLGMKPNTVFSPKHLRKAREVLGLSAAGLALALQMPGRWADRTIRSWETDGATVPGAVAVAVLFMLAYGVPE